MMFLVFGGECYYASGGGYDLLFSDEIESEAVKFARDSIGKEAVFSPCDWDDDPSINIQWSHVLDTNTKKVIHTFGRDTFGRGMQVIEIRKGIE